MKKKLKNYLKFIILSLALFYNTNLIYAQTNYSPAIYINSVQLKFRTLEEEKQYFKDNYTALKEYVGFPFLENNTVYIPLKKSADLMYITYTIKKDSIKLTKDDIILDIKIGSNEATLHKNQEKHKIKINPVINTNDNIYIPIDLLEHLNFEINNNTQQNIIDINHKDNEIEKIDINKYKDVLKYIKNERYCVGNNQEFHYFINDKNLNKILLLNKNEKDNSTTISIPKGDYLQNFSYGKMIFLKNGKIVAYPKRQKDNKYLSYYLNKSGTIYMQKAHLDFSDEIIIYCPYCKSEYIIKIKNPFKKCDCEK